MKKQKEDIFDSAKSLAAKHGVTGIVAMIISSIVPISEHVYPHASYATQQSVQASETRTDNQISALRTEQDKKIQDLWKAISTSHPTNK